MEPTCLQYTFLDEENLHYGDAVVITQAAVVSSLEHFHYVGALSVGSGLCLQLFDGVHSGLIGVGAGDVLDPGLEVVGVISYHRVFRR